jgi:ferredoxin-NADP reductase
MPITTFTSEVLGASNLSPSVKLVKVTAPENFRFKPGQYLSVSVMIDGKKIRVPYSIATTPNKNAIEFCVKKVKGGAGAASSYMHNLVKGDEVELFGPAGKFTISPESPSGNKDLFFISVGTGISAFVSMIPSLLESGFKNRVVLLKGFRHEEDILYDKEFANLVNTHSNFEFHNILSQPNPNDFEDKGYVQDFLEKYLPENFTGNIYICGLTKMINAVKDKLNQLEISKEQIFVENYD